MAQPMGDLLADPAKCRVCKQPCVARTKRGAVEHVGCAGWQDPPPQGVPQDPWGSLNVSALASKLGAVVISDEVEVRTPSRQDQSQNLVFGALCVVCGKICTTELHFDNRQVPVHEECLMARKEYKHPGALETELTPQDCPTCGETIWCGYFGGIEYRIDPVRLGTASLQAAVDGDVPVAVESDLQWLIALLLVVAGLIAALALLLGTDLGLALRAMESQAKARSPR